MKTMMIRQTDIIGTQKDKKVNFKVSGSNPRLIPSSSSLNDIIFLCTDFFIFLFDVRCADLKAHHGTHKTPDNEQGQ